MWVQHLPRQVTHLSLEYAFTTPASAQALESATIERWSRREHPSRHPNIRHLSLSGATAAFASAILRARVCPNVETLEIAHLAQLTALAPLPSPVRTLILRPSGVALSKNMMVLWALDAALDAGLFAHSEGAKPRIVVRSGTPDPIAFITLRRTCRRFEVDLVYKRDDSRSPSHLRR